MQLFEKFKVNFNEIVEENYYYPFSLCLKILRVEKSCAVFYNGS